MDRRPAHQYYHLDLHPSVPATGEEFKLSDAEWLGFDLDHTIVRYTLETFMPLAASCIIRYLVEEEGYPASLLEREFPFEFAKKGLVIDKELGNVVKLDCKARVLQGAHGSRWLSGEELEETYGADPLPDFAGVSTERYWPLNTFFDIPCAPVFAALVDVEGGEGVGKWPAKSYADLTADIYKSVNFNYLSFEGGHYFQPFKADPGKYVPERKDIRDWLLSLRKDHGFKLFLATNSMPEYSKLLLDHAFGKGAWEDVFDVVLFKCRKPAFFTEHDVPFQEVTFGEPESKSESESEAGGGFEQVSVTFRTLEEGEDVVGEGGRMYHMGSASALHRGLGIEDPSRVVYFGDHIPYDCGAGKELAGWRTVGVVEEVDYDRSHGSDPSGYNAWSCFFTYDNDGAHNAALHEDSYTHQTYHKKWMDQVCDAVVPDLTHLIGVDPSTVLNETSFFVNSAVPPLPFPGMQSTSSSTSEASAGASAKC